MIARHRAVRRAAWILVAAGIAALSYSAYVVANAQIYQTAQRRQLEQARAVPTSPPVAAMVPVTPAPAEGDVVGEIDIPRLGLAAIIAEGDSPAILKHAVGHLADSALPGETGNVVLAGHRDTFFRPLKQVRVGDTITVKTRRGDFDYLVESTLVVSPDDVEVLEPVGGRTLTLVTCYPFFYVGSAPNRFIVRAREAGTSAGAGRTR